eukprot:TRINITY_DN22372_c0_g1_i1.p2 TRINITY_DN22372_c0_g1~~TRINITY_DN22372_c0_g1_i1.p2  ORF type:complete len:205 (+),score=25.74 TRINITY_DN22372_c0_g1_i1:447-1061(+)
MNALLEAGASLMATTSHEHHLEICLYAPIERQDECLRMLQNHGADLNATDNQGRTVLHYACALSSVGTVRVLIKLGVPINTPSNVGTPLQIAVRRGHRQLERLLLDSGADPHQPTSPSGAFPYLPSTPRGVRQHLPLSPFGADPQLPSSSSDADSHLPSSPNPRSCPDSVTPMPELMPRGYIVDGDVDDALANLAQRTQALGLL